LIDKQPPNGWLVLHHTPASGGLLDDKGSKEKIHCHDNI